MTGKKVFIEQCEHEWIFECILEGVPFILSMENLKFIQMTPTQKEELFQKLSEALK